MEPRDSVPVVPVVPMKATDGDGSIPAGLEGGTNSVPMV